jgi:uncharacterized membrane protein HdeD (DUF308 family)
VTARRPLGPRPPGTLLDALAEITGKWHWLLAVGVAEVVAGIVAVAYPGVTIAGLAVVVGIALLVFSVATMIAAAGVPAGVPGRGWAVGLSVAGIVAGLIALTRPGAGLYAVLVALGVWLVVAGIDDFARAATHPKPWLVRLFGALSLVAGVVVLIDPWTGVATVALVVGLWFIVRGVLHGAAALLLRRAYDDLR